MDLFNLSLKYGDEVFSIHAGYESARITLDPNEGTAAQDLNAFLNGLVSAGILTPDYVNYFSGNYVRASFRGIGYQFDWKNIVSMGEIVKRKFATPVVPSVVGWYMMGGYRFNQFLPHITFARSRVVGTQVRRFNSTINEFFMAPPPFGAGSPVTLDEVASQIVASSPYVQGGVADQSSVTFGLRWDVYDGVAIKGEYKHIHPDSGTPGLFNVNPQKSVNIFSLAVDAVM
jgi:hypothetical protein